MSRLARALAALGLAAILSGGAGCGGDPRYTLVVEVVADDGKPLPGVKVTLGDGTVGITDDLGQLRRRVAGEEGSRFAVTVEPPVGYNPVGAGKGAVVLRHLVDADGQGKKPIEFQVKLAPTTRTYAILVRTSTAGIPVVAFGTRKATTNRAGVAMFLYEGTPGEQLSVKLDTTDRPSLSPQNPTTTFQLPSRQQAFVVKEHFTSAPIRVSRPKPKRFVGPRPL